MKVTVFKKRSVRYMLAISICGILSLLMISVVSGRPNRLKKLPNNGKNSGCGTCHIKPKGGGERNSFGKDYQKIGMKAGDKYTAELGKLDSDGDGFTNDQEFAAGTRPENAESKPAAADTKAGVNPLAELEKALEKGKALFNDTKLGTRGRSCNSCHSGDDTSGHQMMGMKIPPLKGAAATYPKYNKRTKRVITLSQMDNMMISMVLKGEPLKLESDEAIALVVYVTSLSNGAKIQVGGK